MENKGYGSVIGAAAAPYENRLAAACGLATDYSGVAHPSLPNYIAATSGSTHGVADDAGPAAHPLSGQSLFSLVQDSGRQWRTYAESMPGNCAESSSGQYAVKHNPAVYYTGLRAQCRQWDVPLGDGTAGPFATALHTGALPAFTMVIPNLCNDTHDCPVSTGDAWLAAWLPRIFASPAYQSGQTVLAVTWDEGGGGSDRVPLLVAGPTVPPGTRLTQRADHYALLRTTLEVLGLPVDLGRAATARSLQADFHLP